MATDTVVFYTCTAVFVIAHALFSGVKTLGWPLFPWVVVLANVGIVVAYGVKVVALGMQGGGTQFSSWTQETYPLLSLSAGTGAAIALLIWRDDRMLFLTFWAFLLAQAGLEMWVSLALSLQDTDIIASTALGFLALIAFPVMRLSETTSAGMRLRLSSADEGVKRQFERAPSSALVRAPVPRAFIPGWLLAQVYVSLKYFLDARVAADVFFVVVLPLALSVALDGTRLESWMHLYICCSNARWLVFCAWPTFANAAFNATSNPAFFVYSSWTGAAPVDQYTPSLFLFSVAALTFAALAYFFPLRGGHSVLCVRRPRPATTAPPPILPTTGFFAMDVEMPTATTVQRRVRRM